jgi:biopolymer transport protein ExbD
MARPKLPRKSTNVDMTAMCDVAFLLLTFFILATKFKPPVAIEIITPKSVASKVAPTKDVVLVSVDRDGRVFFSVEDADIKNEIANEINTTKNLGIDVNAFVHAPFIGVPFSQLKSFLAMPEAERKANLLTGIPVDTPKGPNEMIDLMRYTVSAYQGKKMNLLLKGNNKAKYPSIEGVINAFKKTYQLKFEMRTNPAAVPTGSELWKLAQKGQRTEE